MALQERESMLAHVVTNELLEFTALEKEERDEKLSMHSVLVYLTHTHTHACMHTHTHQVFLEG